MLLRNRILVFAAIVTAFAIMTIPAPGAFAQTAPVITIDTPLPGRVYHAGEIMNVRWRTTQPGNVRIAVYKGGSLKSSLTSSTPSPGTLPWAIPRDITVATDYEIRITTLTSPAGTYSSGAFEIDLLPDTSRPTVSGLRVDSTTVREQIDKSVTINGTASDLTSGGSDIALVEYYVNTAPARGSGTAMTAVDGTLNAPLERVTATIDTSMWTRGVKWVGVRAQDAAGNWSADSSISLLVVDVTPPEGISDLSAKPVSPLVKLAATVSDSSASGSTTPATSAVDGKMETVWQTAGSTTSQSEWVNLDLGGIKSVSGVAITPGKASALMPGAFDIQVSVYGTSWRTVASAEGFKGSGGAYFWQFDPTNVRFVRVMGPGVINARDRRYYWQIAEVTAYSNQGGSAVEATWTSPVGDTRNNAKATRYDARWSTQEITEANFASCAKATGMAAPKAPGTKETQIIRTGAAAGDIYVVVKAVDASGNESTLSNVAKTSAGIVGFTYAGPGDAAALSPAQAPTFAFVSQSDARSTAIVFSGSPKHAPRPESGATARLSVRAGSGSLTPSAAQWIAMKRAASDEGTLYWRMEGSAAPFKAMYGKTMALHFDSGRLTGAAVSPTHTLAGGTAVWPDKSQPPAFSWTDGTTGMTRFFVDVSIESTISLTDRKKAMVLGGSGVTSGSSLRTKPAEWLKMRQAAARSGGVLYWRVRATDDAKALSTTGAVQRLMVDGGAWTLSDLSLGSTTSQVTWTHAGQGIVKCSLQFSPKAAFETKAGATLKIQAGSATATSYTLSAADMKKLRDFAARNGVTALYFRVCGEDADRAFIAASAAKATLP